jgi:hypothetical protein
MVEGEARNYGIVSANLLWDSVIELRSGRSLESLTNYTGSDEILQSSS